jgi:hypothetical protein
MIHPNNHCKDLLIPKSKTIHLPNVGVTFWGVTISPTHIPDVLKVTPCNASAPYGVTRFF